MYNYKHQKFDPIAHLAASHIEFMDPEKHDLWVIGDVHGCYEEYKKLCDLASKTSSENGKYPVIAQLGDIIDRGPCFYETILEDPADIKLMGNHEWNFILEQLKTKPCRSKSRKISHSLFEKASTESQFKIMKLLKARKSHFIIITKERNYVLSHAPRTNVESGPKTMKTVFGNMSLKDWAFRSSKVEELNQDSNFTYIHGHQSWAYEDIKIQISKQEHKTTQIYNLDSGCVYGNELIAFNPFDKTVLSVKSNFNVDFESESL